MAELTWDAVGERFYETGVSKGVLYVPVAGVYDNGVAWNGLTAITDSPSGAEPTPVYADNIKYLNLMSVEEHGGTIEALTFPDEFLECDGVVLANPGVAIGQQNRKPFGLCWRTEVGNDVDGVDHAYKLHLVYGAQAQPSEKAYNTINDSPEATPFSWEYTTTPVAVTGHKPSAKITIDSREVSAADMTALEAILYGDETNEARLPLPDEVITLTAAP